MLQKRLLSREKLSVALPMEVQLDAMRSSPFSRIRHPRVKTDEEME
jgi:hypothetical protein